MLISVGDKVHPGIYKVHSRFARVVNFNRANRLVSVVDETIGPGPVNIVIRDMNQARVDLLEVRSSCIRIGPNRYQFPSDRIFRSAIPAADIEDRAFEQNLKYFENILIKKAPARSLAFLLDQKRLLNFRSAFDRAWAGQIQQGWAAWSNGQLSMGIGLISGCGIGLTPGGDDFIAGMLIALNLFQILYKRDCRRLIARVLQLAKGQSLLSNTFLEMAGRGLVFEKMQAVIRALFGRDQKALGWCVGRLLSIGATSGADLATGFLMTFRNVQKLTK